jgi:hypothetical protein
MVSLKALKQFAMSRLGAFHLFSTVQSKRKKEERMREIEKKADRKKKEDTTSKATYDRGESQWWVTKRSIYSLNSLFLYLTWLVAASCKKLFGEREARLM